MSVCGLTVADAWMVVQTAGMISKVFEHPFDLVKVRLQSQPAHEPAKYRGPVDCFFQTLRGEGLRGLFRVCPLNHNLPFLILIYLQLCAWQGLSMPVTGAMVENACLFVSYNQLQQALATAFPYTHYTKDAPVSHMAAAAAGAGVFTSFLLTPIELVKCRLQVQMISSPEATLAPAAAASTATLKMPGPVGITRQIISDSGLRGLWLGQTGTFLRESGGGVAWFLAYELSARFFARRKGPQATKKDLSVAELMMSGANAGVGYTVFLFPADSIKSTVQTAEVLSRGQQKKGFLQTGIDMYRSKGIAGLYSGCGVTTLKSAGSSALIFSIYALLENVRSSLYEPLTSSFLLIQSRARRNSVRPIITAPLPASSNSKCTCERQLVRRALQRNVSIDFSTSAVKGAFKSGRYMSLF